MSDTATSANIAALRANTNALRTFFYVAGYRTTSDGGEGAFYQRLGDTTSADTGGDIIVDALGIRWGRDMPLRYYNIVQFGAYASNPANDPTIAATTTAAAQAAITAAGVGGTVYAPPGTFVFTATLQALANQQFLAGGTNGTIFRRFTDYGDTLAFTNAGAARVSGIWFWHGVAATDGLTHLNDTATTGAHINLGNFQDAVIENCWMWRMPLGINAQQGAGLRVSNCWITGVWNSFSNADATTREGLAGIQIGSAGYTQLVQLDNNYLAGPSAGPESVNYTTSDGTIHTVNLLRGSAGVQYGILVRGCEGLTMTRNYIGGSNVNNILLAPSSTLSEVRCYDNFFDSAGWNSACISIQPNSNGIYPSMVSITNNKFNGEQYAYKATTASNPLGTSPSASGLTISGNIFQAIVGNPIALSQVEEGLVTDNEFYGYNCLNLSPNDPNFCSAVIVANCIGVTVENNKFGGNTGAGYPTSYCYLTIVQQGNNTNFSEGSGNTCNGTGPSGTAIGRRDKPIAVVRSASYQMQGWESAVLVYPSGPSVDIIVPPTPCDGHSFTIKDASGASNTSPIAIVGGTFDGASANVIATPLASRTFVYSEATGIYHVIGN